MYKLEDICFFHCFHYFILERINMGRGVIDTFGKLGCCTQFYVSFDFERGLVIGIIKYVIHFMMG